MSDRKGLRIPLDFTGKALQRTFWPKVVLIGSMRFYHEMVDVYEKLEKKGVHGYVPWAFLADSENPKKFASIYAGHFEGCERYNVETHLFRIDASDMAYVVNPSGYVGLNSAVDIGCAAGRGISIYSMEIPVDLGIKTLIDSVKTPKEIIQICAELKESKYKPLLRQFEKRLKRQKTTLPTRR